MAQPGTASGGRGWPVLVAVAGLRVVITPDYLLDLA
jgi:hypothetical protein